MSRWIFEPGHTAATFCARHVMVTWVRGRFTGIHGWLELEPGHAIDAALEGGDRRHHHLDRRAQPRRPPAQRRLLRSQAPSHHPVQRGPPTGSATPTPERSRASRSGAPPGRSARRRLPRPVGDPPSGSATRTEGRCAASASRPTTRIQSPRPRGLLARHEMVPYTIVCEPGPIIYKIYNGYWFCPPVIARWAMGPKPFLTRGLGSVHTRGPINARGSRCSSL
jgi:hypothetical protein